MARQVWINFQAKVLQYLPPSLAVMAGNLRHLPSYAAWWLHPQGRRRAIELLAPLRGRYHGCRCVVIGNGPSLKKMDLAPLRHEFTFGLNRIYLLFEKWGFETTFLVAINRFVLEQFGDELGSTSPLKILNWSYRQPELEGERACFLETRPTTRPDGDLLRGFYAGGGTVTNVALQAAYFMGFTEVILIGVDHSYRSQGVPNQAVRAESEDESHFSKDYFGPGIVWQLPDLEAMERGYWHIRELFEGGRRRVLDATVGGQLEVFPKVGFEEILETSPYQRRKDFEPT